MESYPLLVDPVIDTFLLLAVEVEPSF